MTPRLSVDETMDQWTEHPCTADGKLCSTVYATYTSKCVK